MLEELSLKERAVLDRVKEHSRSSIKEIVGPLKDQGSYTSLRNLIHSLARRKFLILDNTRRTDRTSVGLTKKGRAYVRVGTETPNQGRGSQ